MLRQTITQAIQERRKLEFIYQRRLRIVDPQVFGRSTAGNEVVLCWQTGGSSSKPNDIPNWRTFETNKISDLRLTNDNFIPRSHPYNPFESDIQIVYAKV